jgi:hypothetical protein
LKAMKIRAIIREISGPRSALTILEYTDTLTGLCITIAVSLVTPLRAFKLEWNEVYFIKSELPYREFRRLLKHIPEFRHTSGDYCQDVVQYIKTEIIKKRLTGS